MKALFVTTETVDCANHVRAWNSFALEPAKHVTYDHDAICNGWRYLEIARELQPEVIFYIGAAKARGNPRPSTFREMRTVAPLILLCSDATDKPWHPVLRVYHNRECFDLIVAIDGARDAPVDFATLTPVDPIPFSVGTGIRNIRCGFSGTVGNHTPRSEILNALRWFDNLTIRDREPEDGYDDHAGFMTGCQSILNLSWAGSGRTHHVKGRVLEAGWAGCALLEHADSPISSWFPDGCWLPWRTPIDAASLIKNTPDDEIALVAQRLSNEVRTRFRSEQIYGSILERVGLNVGPTVARSAAQS